MLSLEEIRDEAPVCAADDAAGTAATATAVLAALMRWQQPAVAGPLTGYYLPVKWYSGHLVSLTLRLSRAKELKRPAVP